MTARQTYPHFQPITTRWKDNDIYGHVNNVEYYSYFDTVINTYLIRQAGLDIQAGPAIGLCAESHCRFLDSLGFPDAVDAGLRVAKLGNSSVRYEIGLFREGSATPAAEGWFVHVFVDREKRRPCPIPPPLREALARLAAPEVAAMSGRVKVRGAVLRQMGLPAPYAQSRPLTIETLELDPPGPGELRVRVRAAGLCHSDLSVIDGSRPRVMPMVLGHEAAGEVLECGPGVADFAPGDQVVFSFVPGCGHCNPCASGRPALCEPGAAANVAGSLLSGARRWHPDAQGALHHHLGVSAFAEQTVVSARSAVKVDAKLPPQIAALFGCAVMTGVGAAVNTARIQAGESAAIFGLGGVGLAALLGAHASGAHPLVAVDVVPSKLKLARELGATHVVDARESDPVQAVRHATAGGAHHAIETVGNEQVLVQAYGATRRGGTTVTAGLPHPGKLFSVPAVSLVAEERTVKGSYMGSAVPSRDLPRYIALYQAGRLPVDRLLTHTLKLDEINEGFDRLARGEAVRQVIVFD